MLTIQNWEFFCKIILGWIKYVQMLCTCFFVLVLVASLIVWEPKISPSPSALDQLTRLTVRPMTLAGHLLQCGAPNVINWFI